jgi:hypothetical protein
MQRETSRDCRDGSPSPNLVTPTSEIPAKHVNQGKSNNQQSSFKDILTKISALKQRPTMSQTIMTLKDSKLVISATIRKQKEDMPP